MWRVVIFIACVLAAVLLRPASAQDQQSKQPRPMTSQCIAMADAAPMLPVRKASYVPSYVPVAVKGHDVKIGYIGHSTFLIQSPDGAKIATDFTGYAGPGILPDVVTMNHAHSSHYTDFPDPGIKHVLRGWNPAGGYAHHNLTVKDAYIRNVVTNTRDWGGGTVLYGNSIFIFEIAGLCIGHLGHLQHELTAQQVAQIGQLDIVMVPVDGFVTLDFEGMQKVLTQLKARVVIPMHYFTSGSLEVFIAKARKHYDVRVNDTAEVVFSVNSLPKKPQVLVLRGF